MNKKTKPNFEAMIDEFRSFAQQVINDIEGIEKEYLPDGQIFAEWSSVANTKRWAEKLIKKYESINPDNPPQGEEEK